MSSGLHKVRAGEPLHIPAKAYNAFVDAALDHQQRSMSTAGDALRDRQQRGLVLVRNESGAAQAQFDVLGIDGPIITRANNPEAFRSRIALRGVTPTAAHLGRFVILHDALPAGAVGRAYLTGACLARVRMQDEAHTAADVNDGETGQLASVETGAASLLWIEPVEERDDPEIAWAVVRFGGGGGAGDGSISAGSSLDAALTAWEQFDAGDASNPLFRYAFEERIFTAAGTWIPAEHLHTITYSEHSTGSAGTGSGASAAALTTPASGGRIIDEPASYDPPGSPAAYDAIDATIGWNKGGNTAFWVYVGTAAGEAAGSSSKFDSGALGDVDSVALKMPKSGTFYITLFYSDDDINTDYEWVAYEVTVTPRTPRTSTSLGVLAVNEEEVNETTLKALRGPIGGGTGGEITDEIVVRLRPLTMYDEDTGEPATIYTFWRPKVPWVGVTVAHTPDEWTDNRYDVARAQVSNTDSDATSIVGFAALGGEDAETVTATNLLEQVDGTHLLPVGTPVVVLPVRGGDNPHVPRYVFLGAMGGGLEIGSPNTFQQFVQDVTWQPAPVCQFVKTLRWLELTPITIGGVQYRLIKDILTSAPT